MWELEPRLLIDRLAVDHCRRLMAARPDGRTAATTASLPLLRTSSSLSAFTFGNEIAFEVVADRELLAEGIVA